MPIPSKSIQDIQEAQYFLCNNKKTNSLMTTKANCKVNRHHKVAVREILSACLVYLWRNEPSKCIRVLTDRHARIHMLGLTR